MKKFMRDFSPGFEKNIDSRTVTLPTAMAVKRTVRKMKFCLCNKKTNALSLSK
jgi:hypothetical protein